jgi:hypothetical protein
MSVMTTRRETRIEIHSTPLARQHPCVPARNGARNAGRNVARNAETGGNSSRCALIAARLDSSNALARPEHGRGQTGRGQSAAGVCRGRRRQYDRGARLGSAARKLGSPPSCRASTLEALGERDGRNTEAWP